MPEKKRFAHRPAHVCHVAVAEDLKTRRYIIAVGVEDPEDLEIKQIFSLQPQNARWLRDRLGEQLENYERLLHAN